MYGLSVLYVSDMVSAWQTPRTALSALLSVPVEQPVDSNNKRWLNGWA